MLSSRIQRIKSLLSSLNPIFLEIIDESFLHKGHNGFIDDNSETHIHIKIKANFNNSSLLDKHKQINRLVKSEYNNGLHALRITIL